MKKIILLFLLVSSLAHAHELDSYTCAPKLRDIYQGWKATGEWEKQITKGPKDYFFKSPTQVIGEWVLIKKVPEGSVISRISQKGRTEILLKGKNCQKEIKNYAGSKVATESVDDEKIRKFVEGNKKGVIYVWSPRMVLSEKGIAEIKKASKELKLPLLVLMEKKVSDQEAKNLSKKYGVEFTQRVDSLEFNLRNVDQHYPAVMVFKNAKISPEVKYGYEKSPGYQSDLTGMLKRSK